MQKIQNNCVSRCFLIRKYIFCLTTRQSSNFILDSCERGRKICIDFKYNKGLVLENLLKEYFKNNLIPKNNLFANKYSLYDLKPSRSMIELSKSDEILFFPPANYPSVDFYAYNKLQKSVYLYQISCQKDKSRKVDHTLKNLNLIKSDINEFNFDIRKKIFLRFVFNNEDKFDNLKKFCASDFQKKYYLPFNIFKIEFFSTQKIGDKIKCRCLQSFE